MRLILSSHSSIYISQETHYIANVFGKIKNEFTQFDQVSLTKIIEPVRAYLLREGWEKIPTKEDLSVLFDKDYCSYADFIQEVALFELNSNKRESLLYWGDNTPQYVGSMQLLNILFPECKFIVMVRDPRDVVASALKLKFQGKTPIGIAIDWQQALAYSLSAREKYGAGRVMLLKYENLVLNTNESVKKIIDFLGIDFEDEMLKFYATDDAKKMQKHTHHQSLNKPISSKSIGRFKKDLTQKQINNITLYLAEYLFSLNYISQQEYLQSVCDSTANRLNLYSCMVAEWGWRWLGHVKSKVI